LQPISFKFTLNFSFPSIKRIKQTALDGVDYWQPAHLQLEALGILRYHSMLAEFNNVDPDFDALQALLEPSLLDQPPTEFDLNAIEIADFAYTDSDSESSEFAEFSNEDSYVSDSSDYDFRDKGRCVSFLTLCMLVLKHTCF
jgi:hypothetical protein